jgi:thioredoxin-like negative regulator of GroEL
MSELKIASQVDFDVAKESHRGVLFYFSTPSCSVGEAVEPKVRKMIGQNFPKIKFAWIDMNALPEVAGLNQVFVEPTLLLFVDGKEYLRKSRNFHLSDIYQAIERIYKLAFEP